MWGGKIAYCFTQLLTLLHNPTPLRLRLWGGAKAILESELSFHTWEDILFGAAGPLPDRLPRSLVGIKSHWAIQ